MSNISLVSVFLDCLLLDLGLAFVKHKCGCIRLLPYMFSSLWLEMLHGFRRNSPKQHAIKLYCSCPCSQYLQEQPYYRLTLSHQCQIPQKATQTRNANDLWYKSLKPGKSARFQQPSLVLAELLGGQDGRDANDSCQLQTSIHRKTPRYT